MEGPAMSEAELLCAKCGQTRPVAAFDQRFIGKGTRLTCASCRGVADEGSKWQNAWEARREAEHARERWKVEAERRKAEAERARREAEEERQRRRDQGAEAPAWKLPGTILETPLAGNRWHNGTTCHECNSRIGDVFDPPTEGTAYDVEFTTGHPGYARYSYVACSRTCAERLAQRAPKFPAGQEHTEGRPSDPALRSHGWIHAFREGGDYPEHTVRGGKWMVFLPASRIDAEWEQVKAALHAGRLGSMAKVSTVPSKARREPTHVLIIYTYDGDDTADVWRVRRELRALGYTWPSGWKADAETLMGHYAPHGRVSRYWG